MKNHDLYPAIFKRKSIRKYNPTPLDDDTLQDISKQVRMV